MKHFVVIFAALALVTSIVAQEKKTPLKDQKEKSSYAIGLNIGMNFNKQKIAINPDVFVAGVKDGLAGKPQMTEGEGRETMTNLEKDMESKKKEASQKKASDGEKILAEKKKKEGVKKTARGLQNKDIQKGTGPQPQ